jgi:hypothetical protein
LLSLAWEMRPWGNRLSLSGGRRRVESELERGKPARYGRRPRTRIPRLGGALSPAGSWYRQ